MKNENVTAKKGIVSPKKKKNWPQKTKKEPDPDENKIRNENIVNAAEIWSRGKETEPFEINNY